MSLYDDMPMNEGQTERFFKYLIGEKFYDDDGCDYTIETPMKPEDALDQIIFPLQQMGIISTWFDVCVECGALIPTASDGCIVEENDKRVKDGTPQGYWCENCLWPHMLDEYK